MKKSASKKSAPKKSAPKKSPPKKSAPKKSPPKKSPPKKPRRNLSNEYDENECKEEEDCDSKCCKNNGFERRYGLRYDQPLIRLRILDPALAIHGLTDLTLTLSEFKQFDIPAKTVFIAENKVTVLAFPDYPEAIVIFGLGYAVNLLANAQCLHDRYLYYWGDLDADGLAILARLRQYYPQVTSMLMNAQTLEQFMHLVVHASSNSPEKTLNYLTAE